MQGYFWFVGKRALQMLAVIFCGISATFLVTHLSPIDPVEQVLGRLSSRANLSPEAIASTRAALSEMYGTGQPMLNQYFSFWARLVRGDLGPSLMAFPTPAMTLVMRAMPWTLGLLVSATLVTFVVGNLLGALAGYNQNNRFFKAFGIFAMGIQPIPYYVVAFILLIIFGFLWPVLPISGGFAMDVTPGWNWPFISSVLQHGILPATSVVLVGFGGWFIGMRALVSNIVNDDYVTYAELANVDQKTIVGSYVIRNAIVPQLTALAMALGGVFSGTVITEQVFNYPGLGSLLIDAVNAGDYSLVLAVSTVSITAVAIAIFVVDLLHPLLDPRVRTE
ncbi:ABC transporter permease [Devosia sp. J2-20]|jgi:peptide/nickel transport system permease protein|uniref:ABC transporter permease n=1 Tax=Devosia litorisediminis TaxID=2829817 RepID=A0A942E6N1_9HYPH|nr:MULTISPECIES: ABC transporter permease [Devosia]MBS3849005.1 ABC transporter permease [Devosia litorisediminis]MCZ4344994.1 ABC transporter permease [Devosia neptuniae]WDQ97922.1 ABC transporter permease [Devosia sp. J2-20]|tara:strand:+ start:7888 stop:8892 length:1005 start_codon:yes stop_codon:yes gene_type:complete